jgi:GTP:adenosylcobinamide-phosphate guanylyltransferase
MSGITAIVLAAARGGTDPVAAAAGTDLKAFAPVAGEPMLDRVVAALQAATGVGRIALVTPEGADLSPAPRAKAAVASGNALCIAAAASPSASALAALDALGAPFPVLLVTADHALLTPAMVEEFLTRAPADADIVAALVDEAGYRARFPDSRRTWLRFRDGAYTGCNLFLLRTSRARDALTLWRRVETSRKTPWRLVRLLGLTSIVRYRLGWLTLSDTLARAEKRFGVRVAPLVLSDPEAAIDVDTVADMALVERLIAARSNTATDDKSEAGRRGAAV